MSSIRTNLYDQNISFTLQFEDQTTNILQPELLIIEPDKWNKITNHIPRDSNWFGFWSDFLEDMYGLLFTYLEDNGKTGGAEFLKSIYDQYGDQAIVYFSIYGNPEPLNGKNYPPNTSQWIKSWRIYFQDYESDFGGVQVSIEKMPFQGKLKARMSAPCTINSEYTMDGQKLTPITAWQSRLHSKTLEEETIAITQTPGVSNVYNQEMGSDSTAWRRDFILQPDQSNQVTSELSEVFNQPLGVFDSLISDGEAIIPKIPTLGGLGLVSGLYLNNINQFSPVFSGLLNVKWSGSATIYTAGQCGYDRPSNPSYWVIAPRLVQMRLIGGVWTQISVLDNGGSCVGKVALTSGHLGAGYNIGDTGSINGGTKLAIYTVTAIGGGGAVNAIDIYYGGDGYSIVGSVLTTTITGSGSGLKVDIDAVYPIGSSLISNGTGLSGDWVPCVNVSYKKNFDINSASQQYILPIIVSSGGHTIATLRGNSGLGDCTQYNGYNFSLDVSLQVQAGDLIYVHNVGLVATSGVGTNWGIQFDQYVNEITYNQQTTSPGTTADGYIAIDILNQMVENITGQKNAVISDYYSEGGAGYNRLYTNGYQIRNFQALINQPKCSLEVFLKSLQAKHALAVGIQEINQIEYLRVEYISDFFKPLEIARFTDTFLWKDHHKSAYSYNKAEIGYNKYYGIELVQEDEFNTQGSYLTQFLKYGDNTFQKRSDIIMSGYLIEYQRRLQFALNSNQSGTFDEDIFGVCVISPNIYQNVYYHGYYIESIDGIFSIPVLQFNRVMGLLFGDVINCIVSGHTFNISIYGQTPGYPIIDFDSYLIQSQGDWVSGTPYFKNQIVLDHGAGDILYIAINNITSSINPSSDPTNWFLWTLITSSSFTVIPSSPNQIFAERDQPFSICTGVIDPSTIYNGRDSLKHILYNWRPLLGVGLFFVDPLSQDYAVSQIVTTLVKMNSNFTSQFLSSEPFKGNAGNLILDEFVREQISNYLRNGSNLFSPVGATCQLRCGWNDIETIRMALCGETGNPDIDFGGLVLNDDFGNLWFCHVMDLIYDPFKEICTLQVQKCFKVPI